MHGNSIELLNGDDRDEDAEGRFREKYGKTMDGLQNWRQTLWDKVKSGVAEKGTGALGHGAVLKYPDFPYLEWKFSYEHSEGDQRVSSRNNAATFLEACERLYEVFRRLGTDYRDPGFDLDGGFDRIRDVVTSILEMPETDRKKRGAKWCSAASEGTLFHGPEEILPYQEDEWKQNLEGLDKGEESHAAPDQPSVKFYQAAANYRVYVLRDLLPAHGLVVD